MVKIEFTSNEQTITIEEYIQDISVTLTDEHVNTHQTVDVNRAEFVRFLRGVLRFLDTENEKTG